MIPGDFKFRTDLIFSRMQDILNNLKSKCANQEKQSKAEEQSLRNDYARIKQQYKDMQKKARWVHLLSSWPRKTFRQSQDKPCFCVFGKTLCSAGCRAFWEDMVDKWRWSKGPGMQGTGDRQNNSRAAAGSGLGVSSAPLHGALRSDRT